MPSLDLYLHHADPSAMYHFVRPGSLPEAVPRLRLVVYANLSAQLASAPGANRFRIALCVVDTGSHIATIPEDIWRRFRPGVVTPLPFAPNTQPCERQLVVAGGSFPFELGELAVRLEDQRRRHMIVTVVAQLTRDGGRLRIPMTIGLRGGVIDGRRLTAVPDPRAPFGQAWALEEA